MTATSDFRRVYFLLLFFLFLPPATPTIQDDEEAALRFQVAHLLERAREHTSSYDNDDMR